jgi:hypothetical protein
MAFMEDIEIDFCVLLGMWWRSWLRLHYKLEGHGFDS